MPKGFPAKPGHKPNDRQLRTKTKALILNSHARHQTPLETILFLMERANKRSLEEWDNYRTRRKRAEKLIDNLEKLIDDDTITDPNLIKSASAKEVEASNRVAQSRALALEEEHFVVQLALHAAAFIHPKMPTATINHTTSQPLADTDKEVLGRYIEGTKLAQSITQTMLPSQQAAPEQA